MMRSQREEGRRVYKPAPADSNSETCHDIAFFSHMERSHRMTTQRPVEERDSVKRTQAIPEVVYQSVDQTIYHLKDERTKSYINETHTIKSLISDPIPLKDGILFKRKASPGNKEMQVEA
ncbi:hypothetical protein TNIN_337701 [Trichonephila inaurata madagascariensis]|uniref:Uncharacterized protein n=1 Tax=Trichonephila inaurata madagascariensis TaxID=2747483 RepID=A0A8X6I6G6_9ARAC|nr:hypothetical protein TNIN_337701 [Trichonephila inaurata madagascariensis]